MPRALLSLGEAAPTDVFAATSIPFSLIGLGLIAVVLVVGALLRRSRAPGPTRRCPECAELIPKRTRKCSYCGNRVSKA